ncbi:MAG: hypothetical protein RIS44_1872, partial [Pseudomonadota bacterium]
APWALEVIPKWIGFSRVAADDLLPRRLLVSRVRNIETLAEQAPRHGRPRRHVTLCQSLVQLLQFTPDG